MLHLVLLSSHKLKRKKSLCVSKLLELLNFGLKPLNNSNIVEKRVSSQKEDVVLLLLVKVKEKKEKKEPKRKMNVLLVTHLFLKENSLLSHLLSEESDKFFISVFIFK